MRHRANAVAFMALLMVGCSAPVLPQPAPAVSPIAQAVTGPAVSADPCASAVSLLGAFTRQVADELAAIRPLVVARQFDVGATGSLILRVNADLVAYSGLGSALQACQATKDLAARFGKLASELAAAMAPALAGSVNDPELQRRVAVACFGFLPEVVALSRANNAIAASLALDALTAQVSRASAKPLGSLPPLPTLAPQATARPTPRPTSGTGAGSSGGSSGSGGSDWTVQARAYLTSALDTYDVVTRDAGELYGADLTVPGLTPGEIAAREAEYALYWKPAVRVLNAHLSYMTTHKARLCYADAYTADRALAKVWLSLLQSGDYPGDFSPSGRQATIVWDAAMSRTTTFLGRLSRYMADCP